MTAGAIRGTVDVHVARNSVDYAHPSETLVRGAPMAAFRELIRSEASGPRLRPADLVEELQLINDEIHRIMSKVEQAVAKLATNIT